MTLVVAQKHGNAIAAVSDTGVIEHGVKLGPLQQIPKICIVAPDLAIGFAGNPDLAARAINALPESAYGPGAVDYLLGRHRDENNQVDFLVMFGGPEPGIVRIRQGCVSPVLTTAWIGDQIAFEAFQRLRHSGPNLSVTSVFENPAFISTREAIGQPDNPAAQMLDTLRLVASDPSVGSVFGFCVAVTYGDGEFQYIDYAMVLTEQKFLLALPERFLQEMAPERDELRSFALSCLVTEGTADVRGLAFHFPRGGLTYTYFGPTNKVLRDAYLVEGKNVFEIRKDLAQQYGGDWRGGVALLSPPPPAYGVTDKQWTRIDQPRHNFRIGWDPPQLGGAPRISKLK